MLQITNVHATAADKPILTALALTLAICAAPAHGAPDGWDHSMKPPERSAVFATPYDVLVATNQGVDARERGDVAIRSKGTGQVTVDVTRTLTFATNPGISAYQTRYTLTPARPRGWHVIDAKERWLCRAKPKAGWQGRADSCAGK